MVRDDVTKGVTDMQCGCIPVDVWPVIEKYLDPSSLSFAFGQKLLPFLGFQGCKTLLILKRGCSMHIYCLPGRFRTTFYKKNLFHLLLILRSYMKLFVLLQNSVLLFLNLGLILKNNEFNSNVCRYLLEKGNIAN